MKNLNLLFKSIVQRKARWLLTFIAILTLGVGQMWGASIFDCGIDVNDTWYKGTGTINGGHWLNGNTAFNDANLGVLNGMVLGGQYDTWDNNQTDYCSWNDKNGIWITIKKGATQKANFKLSCFHAEFSSNNNTWKTSGGTGGCSDSGTWGTYTVDISGYAAGNDYTIKASWTSPSGQSTAATASFTIPGFTTTSTSQTFANTTVGSNSSKTISFTQHYGTALTTSNCALSGTNSSEFEVTAISETGVTVKFKPSTAGNKSATLTITDAHSKTCTISLTGKTQYTVSYNKGSNGTGSNTTANKVYGTNLTLLGATFTRTGYTQTAWNTNSAGTGGTSYALSGTYSTEAAVTLYPTWTVNNYDITYDPAEASNCTYTTTPDNADYNTTVNMTITPDANYVISSVTVVDAGSNSVTVTGSSPNYSFTMPASNVTVTIVTALNSVPVTYGVGGTNGSLAAKVGEVDVTSGDDVDGGSQVDFTATPDEGYQIEGWYTSYSAGTFSGKIDAAGTEDTYTIDEATSDIYIYVKFILSTYTITYDLNGGDNDDDNPDSYQYTDDDITLQDPTKEGYDFDGWYTDEDVWSDQVTVIAQHSTGDIDLYAKWSPKTCTVSFNALGGTSSAASTTVSYNSTYGAGTGLSGAMPTVTPPTGYVFSGWYTLPEDGSEITASTVVTATTDHTLYAHYAQKTQVYFKNTLGWSNVFVTYDAYWSNDYGTGNNGKIYHKMNNIPGTDIYYDDIPDAILSSWAWNIAFNDRELLTGSIHAPTTGNYGNYNTGGVIFRMDFDSKATMFVPTSNKTNDQDGNYQKNGAQYYSSGYSGTVKYTSGYWRTYNNTFSGYTLTYQKSGGSWTSGIKMNTTTMHDSTYVYTVHMDANSQYNFSFYKEIGNSNDNSRQFVYGTKITTAACTNLKLVSGNSNAWMQTTVAGDYTFKLTMKSDGHMYLTVEYPFRANDYKVVYSYTKGSAQTHESEIIRARANGVDTISLFIHSGDSATNRSLSIYKCTGINGSGIATWTSYATITLPSETASGKTSGVYNFIITQDGSSAASGEYWEKYDGNYYIRTSSSDGGWDLYKHRSDNIMTLSEYSLTQTLSPPYSHYYCRYIGSTSTDITYAIATDYSPNISGIMIGDATIGGAAQKTLPAVANVRFAWNDETNNLVRAYLKSAQGAGNTRFLVLHGSDNKVLDKNGNTISASGSLYANELQFVDLGNWVYSVSLKVQPGAAVSLIANYNSSDRYLVGGASQHMTILGGTGSTKYDITAVFDFKSNHLLTAWTPSGAINDALTDVDVMLVREAQNAATTLTIGTGSLTAKKMTGALKFDYDDMVGHVSSWSTSRHLLKYFISFPFDVNVSDVFGLNSAYGDAYVIEKYNGAERAEKGFFRGDGITTFWEELTLDSVMHAYEGYCVILDNDYFNGDVGSIWNNVASGSSVYLYFPSANNMGTISTGSRTIKVPAHECTIDRTFTENAKTVNHKITDSHWNLMGLPVFNDYTGTAAAGEPGSIFLSSATEGENFKYFYSWSTSDNKFSIANAVGFTFKAMHSYMVQYFGDVTFTGSVVPASVAPRRTQQTEKYDIELQVLNSNEDMLNRTYVELREEACDTFALDEDVYMSPNGRAIEIYSFAGNYDVAANVLSVGNHNVQLGVIVNQAGTYTFTMPNDFTGTATLIDTQTQTRTDLSFGDYTVNLPKGVDNERFILELNINQVVTSLENENGNNTLNDGGIHKFIRNGQMFIIKNGVIYDAQGRKAE